MPLPKDFMLDQGLQICVPYTKKFNGAFIDSLLYSYKPKPLFWKRLYGFAVDWARNELVANFLENPERPRFLLFIDNDATWEGEAIKRLMEHDLPFVCGCMYTRSLPPTPTMGLYDGQSQDGMHFYRYGETIQRILEQCEKHKVGLETKNAVCFPQSKDDLWEIDGCGMHFTMIRRDVLEALKPPWFTLSKGKAGTGEDFFFCKNAREAGFPIYADMSIHTGHLVDEDMDFGLREMLSYLKFVDPEYGITDGRWSVEGWK